jgi:hypothetical protein
MFGAGMNPWLDGLIGGWTITGINSMLSGQTINLRYQPSPVTANLATFLGGVALRPNVSGPVLAPADQRTIDNYFNKANITIPTVDQPFGTAGRNTARSNAFYQLDFGLQKNFHLPINESSRLEFRMEAFNLFNKTNFGAANSDRSSSAFGTIRTTFPARQIQLAAKVSF